MDSFHECLQEYGEGLEVVQICLEPEESSMRDEEFSALGDLSFDDCKKESIHDDIIDIQIDNTKMNGIKSSKSDDSLDQDDDMTITEDVVEGVTTPRNLLDSRSKSADRKENGERRLWKQQSKDISTSDEMVFAVTPTGLERISFDKYWKEGVENSEKKLEKVKSDESWKECTNSPSDVVIKSNIMNATQISVQEETKSLLFIDHEIDGYETCLDEDSSLKCIVKNGRKMNGDEIKDTYKQNKIAIRNKDNDVSAKIENSFNNVDDFNEYGHPYVQEHIIKQMKSLRIEPLNVNICKKRKRSPTKPSKSERIQCVEYYNDQAECLKEIRRKKLEDEDKKFKEEQKKVRKSNLAAMEKKLLFKKQEPSEESTDFESNYVPGCHKCFLENYAYAIKQAYMEETNACKYCDVIRDMLDIPKAVPDRRLSAPALVNLTSSSETDDEDLLMVPVVKGRRKSAGPLKFITPSRRPR